MEARTDVPGTAEVDQSLQGGLRSAAESPLIRISCPSCRKHYSVSLDQLQKHSASSASPSYQCVTCPTRFAVKFPVDLVTQSAETAIIDSRQALRGVAPERATPERAPARRVAGDAAPLAQTKECPKCRARNARVAIECRSCGIVFARFKPDEEERVAVDIQLTGSLELVALWKEVAANYADLSYHEKFVKACYEAGSLPFASQKYARILSVTPEEETAKAMRKRIVALASHKFERTARGGWSFRVPGLTGLAICLGTIVLILGLLLPQARNLSGIGISMLALVIGVRFFLRGPR